jgi:hypothetical protein
VCLQADYMADDADDQTSDRFLEVYLPWLFGWVLFCESENRKRMGKNSLPCVFLGRGLPCVFA